MNKSEQAERKIRKMIIKFAQPFIEEGKDMYVRENISKKGVSSHNNILSFNLGYSTYKNRIDIDIHHELNEIVFFNCPDKLFYEITNYISNINSNLSIVDCR